MTARSMTDRMLGALRLQTAAYEEIEADDKATGEAAFIIVATSLLSTSSLRSRSHCAFAATTARGGTKWPPSGGRAGP